MNRKELEKANSNIKYIDTKLPIFSSFFEFEGQVGRIPFGTVITITGSPGVGKTRYLLQVLEHIKASYPEKNVTLYEYEMLPSHLFKVINSINSTKLDCFNFSIAPEVKKNNMILGIDSIDQWAMNHYHSNYPTADMAQWLKKANDEFSPIILQIHHKTKTTKVESGSALFPRQNSVTIDLLKQKDGTILATTRRKNRWPSGIDQLILEHTETGLKVKKEISIRDAIQSFFTRIIK